MHGQAILAALIGAILFGGAASAEPRLPGGYALVPGSFAEGRQPDGNSVLIAAPGGLIVVDTGRHPAHQRAILDRAAALGLPIAAIVNTHWHLDHSGGNAEIRAAYPEAVIVASRAVEGALSGFLADSREGALAYLASGRADPETEAEIRGDIAATDERVSLLPTDPVTASGERAIAGRRFAVHLASHAATEGDVWLYDAAARTIVAGDLVVAYAPFMDTACVEGWRAALREIAATPFETLIPGHGAPMDRADFERWHAAFEALVDCAASEADDARCAAGWRAAAAPFLGDVAPERVERMIGYYLRTRLRAGPGEGERYCPAGPA